MRYAPGLKDETYEDKGSDLLKCNGRLTPFWMTWNLDTIQIGKGVYIDRNTLLDTELTQSVTPKDVNFWSRGVDYTTDLLLFDEETDNGTVCPDGVGKFITVWPF